MKVPNPERAFVARSKIESYLLDTAHRRGRSKARFFMKLGYSAEEWQVVTRDLIQHLAVNEAMEGGRGHHGTKYVVRGTLVGPSGKKAGVTAVWIVRNAETFPRFVTAYPGDKR